MVHIMKWKIWPKNTTFGQVALNYALENEHIYQYVPKKRIYSNFLSQH